ncbi:MAG: TonB-dependent receptor plug domain-containing protein, partial [Bacteroidota bacterium]
MRLLLTSLFALSLLLCSVARLHAQEPITISGSVTDLLDEPLIGAVVFEKNSRRGTTVGADGTYSFEVPRSLDTLKLVVQLAGFNDFSRSVPAPEGDTYLMDVSLTPLAVEDVVVTGRVKLRKDEFVQSITTLDQNMVSQVAPANLEDVLQNISGYSNTGQISLRGSSGYSYGAGSRVVTLLNNMPIMTPNLGSTETELLPTDNIQQVEVIKGASSVLYGSGAMGGVINVITKEPTED